MVKIYFRRGEEECIRMNQLSICFGKENGINLLHKKYGHNLTHISYRILNNMSDAEKCVNDTYLRTWNSIPKARPGSLLAYTGRIIRNLSIDRLKKKMSHKRECDNFLLILSELDDCIASGESLETAVEYKELSHDISVFLLASGSQT